MKNLEINIISVISALTLLNLIIIMFNRTLWIQIILVGLLVAETATVLIYSGVELLGISILIVYNGALLILFTLAFLLVVPSRIRPATGYTNFWTVALVLIIAMLYIYEMSSFTEQVVIDYRSWSTLASVDTLKNINFSIIERYGQEFLGVILLLLVGILATLKILKD